MRIGIFSPWFGPRPGWWDDYVQNVHERQGATFLWFMPHNVTAFRERVEATLGVKASIKAGTGKIHDFRPCFGEIFAEELADYACDFWGHTDLDCVYGRLERFYNEDTLHELDIYSDCEDYICGPWTLYRNEPHVNSAFREHPDWREILSMRESTAWIERGYSDLIVDSALRVEMRQQHAYTEEQFLREEDGVLLHRPGEIPFFHFRYSKRWPLASQI